MTSANALKIIRTFLPESKPKKSVLKLGEPVENEDFNVLLHQKEYDFTPENLEEFKAKVLASADPAIPLKTEDLFPFLKDRGLKPLLILSSRDGVKWLDEQLRQQEQIHQQQLTQQAQQFTQQLEQQQQQHQNEIKQLQEQLTQQDQQLKQQQEQMKEIMKHLPSLQPA